MKQHIVFLLLLLLVACKASGRADAEGFTHEGDLRFVRGDSTLCAIAIEIADDDAQRTRGLMYRKHMKDDRGMLFVFQSPAPRKFWMKHTIIPLDILFVRADGAIAAIAEHTTPYSEAGIDCNEETLYVVEVNAGYCAAHGIRPGDSIEWEKK